MDWAGPPGGLEKLFAQYDKIVSHGQGTAMHPASEGSADVPPWLPDDEDHKNPSPLSDKELADRREKQGLGLDPSKSSRDLDADRMERGEQRLNEHIKNPQGTTFKRDEEGLVNAYHDKTAKGVYYDPSNRTEYVKGSVSAQDWKDDFTKIPFWGDTRNAERYQQADDAYWGLGAQGKPVDRVVGHSLGGSVALQMQQDHGIPYSRTFGAPVLQPTYKVNGVASERYRHPLDPVSVFDGGAQNGKFKSYPHTYTDFKDFDRPMKA